MSQTINTGLPDSFDNYSLADWLFFLENRHRQEIQLGLERIQAVAKQCDLLSFDAQVICVAGTNGKGSTVSALATLYRQAGYQVATYTSPHLFHFNERIQVNHTSISDEKLCEAFCFLEQSRGEIHLTYFETATLAAFWYFKQCELDVIILEAGLGGRLDATNIIDADLSIITTVDFDHQAILGSTIEDIAREKAGILRQNRPCLYADDVLPIAILEHAKTLNAPLKSLNNDYSITKENNQIKLAIPSGETLSFTIPAINEKAVAAAIVASHLLQDKLPVCIEEVIKSTDKMVLDGRQTVLAGDIVTICDVAHNTQAAKLLSEFISDKYAGKSVHAVFAAFNDKDIHGIIQALSSVVTYWYPAMLDSKRTAELPDMAEALKSEKAEITGFFQSPVSAYDSAKKKAETGDIIVVFGSFLTVGAVLSHYNDS